MGITTHVYRAMLREHRHRPLTGKCLLIGRQSVLFSVDQMHQIAASENYSLRTIEATSDNLTRAGGEILDTELFATFSDIEVSALDVTDYEGAEYVHDMNTPLPDSLCGQFDFIYNGSCMDNLFNPAIFIINCSKLLKPGGRIIHLEHGSPWPSAYLTYSPDWFLDYYAANDFEDALVMSCEFDGYKSPHHMQSVWRLFRWNPLLCGNIREHSMLLNSSSKVILTIAEKGMHSSSDIQPLQGQYRAGSETEDAKLEVTYRRFLNSERVDLYRSNAGVWSLSPAVSNLQFLGLL